MIKIEGLKALDSALQELKTSTARGVMRRTMVKAMKPIAADASARAPDDPSTPAPDLHREIIVGTKLKTGRAPIVDGFGFKDGIVTVWVGPTRYAYPQAIMQEFGTINQPAQPYLRPAWDAGKGKVLEAMKSGLADEIEKTRKRIAAKAARV